MIPKAVFDTFPENWPAGLQALAVPTTSIPLGLADCWTIGVFSPAFRSATGATLGGVLSATLMRRVERAMAGHTQGVSPRIGFCSWKDTMGSHAPVFGLRGVATALMSGSDRVGRALAAHVAVQRPAVLHLRAWRDIPRHSVVRAFIRDRCVMGVSQYYFDEVFDEMLAAPEAMVARLTTLLSRVLDALHVKTCVVDLCVTEKHPFLIEVNPYLPQTDPCLLSWREPAGFDGSLVLRTATGVARFALGAQIRSRSAAVSP